MAAVSNMAVWLKIIFDRKRPNGAVQLKDIKEATKNTNAKLDALEQSSQGVQTVLARVETRLDGQLGMCAETRERFDTAIGETSNRLFDHIAKDHKKNG